MFLIQSSNNNSSVFFSAFFCVIGRDRCDFAITVYVDPNVKYMGDTVEGLRISAEKPRLIKRELEPATPEWTRAIAAYQRDGKFDTIEKHMSISDENKELIKKDAAE